MATHCHNTPGLPDASLPTYPEVETEARQRLDAFAAQSGTTPPEHILIDEYGDGGTFTTEFLNYCRDTGLSLDWVWFGEGLQTVSREGAA